MNILVSAAFAILALVLAVALTGWLIPILRRRALLDQPTERSSHKSPTLFGGGLAVHAAICICWGLAAWNPLWWPELMGGAFPPSILIGMVILAIVSWFDDLRGLSQIYRLVSQVIVVAGILYYTGDGRGPVFQGLLSAELDTILSGLLWVWFINLFNFMDGIDGISSVETIGVSLGLILLAAYGISTSWLAASILAGVALGFLWWNWHPARIFLGDVGSVPLGFLLGWLLLSLAAEGQWAAALILPFYYLVDATLTLLNRMTRGEKFWESHKQHFYQQAVVKGYSHARVSIAVAIGSLALVGLSLTAVHAPVSGLVGAASVVFVMLLYFKQPPQS